MAWTPPWTWLAGKKPSAADMNREIRDNLLAMTTWVGWGATMTGGFSTAGNRTIAAGKIEVGNLCHFQIILTVGSTSVMAATAMVFSLPNPVPAANMAVGVCSIYDGSTTPRQYGAYANTTTTLACANDAGSLLTGTAPLTLNTGDTVMINGTIQLT
jgi:hypothetical protein